MKNLKLRGKLVASVSIIILFTVCVLSTLSTASINSAYNRVIAVVQEKLDLVIQTQVESMIGVLEANHQRVQAGEITDGEAREAAKDIVRSARYNDGVGYFWADMSDGTSAVHIKPEVEGTNRYDTQDENGNYFVRDTIAAGDKAGGGFIDFYFTKPGEAEAKAKRGFVMKFEPYGWYIGTGNYEEDMLPLIQSELDVSRDVKRNTGIALILCGALVMGIGILSMIWIAGTVSKPIETVTRRLQKLSDGNLHDPVEVAQTRDEVGVLTKSLFQTTQSMLGYIDNISYVLKNMDDGNMDMRIELDFIGDFAPIKESLLNTVQVFNSTLLEINRGAIQVAIGADQVSSQAQALAQGTTEQNISVQELETTISGVLVQVQKNAASAVQADRIAAQSSGAVDSGKQLMQEMISSIEEISQKSNEIGKVIKAIEDIAFQTDILALNAAVEAARAGEKGKGFAVVADEVRSLASKSAEAASYTTALIEGSIKAVERGARIAAETAGSFTTIVENASETSALINGISQASNEQAQSISQIMQSIDQISAVVQSNSATAEESAAASEELSGQAQAQKRLVGRFRLAADSGKAFLEAF